MSPDTDTDTIARLLNQAGAHLKEALRHPTAGHVDMAAPHVDAAMHCIHQAFMEAVGGAAYARPEPSPQPAAPAAVAGWVVRRVYNGHTHYAQRGGSCTNRLDEATRYTHLDADYEVKDWRRQCAGEPGTVIEALPVDAAGNVLEERAPAPDVVAQCRAAESEPAPREPDGWVVVYSGGGEADAAGGAWLTSEGPAAKHYAICAASENGATARPFWLDTPPAATLRAEVGKLRAALRAIAMTVGASVGEQATTDLHCAVADEVRLVVERLTRERDEARLGGVCHALGCMVRAYELDGVTASKLAEMLGWRVGDLHGSGLQAAANMIFEAATELPQALALARQCRDVALGERERLHALLSSLGHAWTAKVVRGLAAPTLPEVP